MGDREFWKFFSVLIASLAALAVVLFILAKSLVSNPHLNMSVQLIRRQWRSALSRSAK